MLILRDLLLGPKRFKDLLEGLPGIATNLLAQRLKEMEENGLVRKTVLPPPGAASVYELTPLGESLEPAIVELGRWGVAVARPQPGDYYSAQSFFVSSRASFNPARARPMDLEFHVDGRAFTVQVVGTKAITRDGPSASAEAVIEADLHALIDLRRGRLAPDEALKSGKVKITSGDKRALHRFVDVFAWRDLPRGAPLGPPPARSARAR